MHDDTEQFDVSETVSIVMDVLQFAQERNFLSELAFNERTDSFKFDINCPKGIISALLVCDENGYSITSWFFTDLMDPNSDKLRTLKIDENDHTIMAELTKFICWGNGPFKLPKLPINGKFVVDYRTGQINYILSVFSVNQAPSIDTIVQSLKELRQNWEQWIDALASIIIGKHSAEDALSTYM